MSFRDRLKALSRWQRVALGVALAASVYAAFGFWAAPPLIRNQAIDVFREEFGREARIGEVRLNPFLLTLDIDRFELPDRDGSPFVRFDFLHVDFELSSIVNRAFTFGEIRLAAPFVHVKVLSDGSLNFGDMIDTLLEEQEDEGAEPEDSEPPPLLVHLARVDEGRIVFSDLSRPTHFEHEVSPLNVELRDFGTRPDDNSPYSFKATTGAGETLEWEGSVSVVPLHSTGRFSLTGVRPRTGWRYVQDDVLFEIVDGTIDVEGSYDLDARNGRLALLLEDGAIGVRDFTVQDRASGENALVVGELDVAGIRASYPEQALHIDSITTRRGRHHMLRLEDGSLRIAQLFEAASEPDGRTAAPEPWEPVATQTAPEPSEPVATQTAPEPSEPVATQAAPDPPQPVATRTEAEAEAQWSVVVDLVRIEDHHIDFEDRSTAPAVELAVGPIALTLEQVTTDLAQAVPLQLDVGFPENGRLHVKGPVRVEPPHAALALEIEGFDLRPFEPYWLPMLDVDLASGRLGVAGRVEAAVEEGEESDLRFAGDVRIEELRAVDRASSAHLLSWAAFELLGLQLATAPMSIDLDRVVLREPRTSIVLAADGTSNLSTIVVAEPASAEPQAEPQAEAEAPSTVPVRIGEIEIQAGAVAFEDRSIQPSFETGITQLSGKISGLSSDRGVRSTVDLTGRIDGSTPMKIQGVASPLAEQTFVDLAVAFENLELSSFTPYSGRHIGKTISRGKLFVDVEYVVDGSSIEGENRVFLDQFTLGEDVDSPDALNLPIGLAIALIKDRNGEIHIDLPVRGDVDDPEFSVGGLIFGALGNLITKVALSPFAMLGGLGGGDGESMKTVSFAAGSKALDPREQSKLDALAEALGERPGLALEITGAASEQVDVPTLQAAALELELRQARFLELQSKWFGDKPESVDEVVLEPDERMRLLQARYEQIFGAKPKAMLVPMLEMEEQGPLAEATPARQRQAWEAELERKVRAEMTIDAGDLRQLAQARSAEIRDYMIEGNGIPAERIFVLDAEIAEGAPDENPAAELSLTVH